MLTLGLCALLAASVDAAALDSPPLDRLPLDPWLLRLELGRVGVEQAYGGRLQTWSVGVGAERRLHHRWSAVVGLEHASLGDQGGGLSIDNRSLGLTAGGKLFHETDTFRFDGRLALGPSLQTSSVRDADRYDETNTRLRLLVDVSGGAAIRVTRALAFGARPGLRLEPGRRHHYVVLALEWAPASGPAAEHRP